MAPRRAAGPQLTSANPTTFTLPMPATPRPVGPTDPDIALEPFTRITHEIKQGANGVCSLTLTHELEGAPKLALILGGTFEDQGAGGGHAWVLSDLKTLLETGQSFAG